ncbi:hypothetical protein HBH98_014120 [Parastagonospora nodorum]|nr:hypothetical protein HBH52_080800 [Parastagonospora nodorum]KAH4069328.1 hypothetical protein HBH50_111760 [Parastagonospora nodorum]KAH4088398.1 hypothetical protein HBH48_128730 [Parastagonospora nodorum]KAH4133027.1 hypothetical protein HBH47_011910 [Parastagonospora nodorum]KAH4177666.1 hypothetical protein HBH43_034710 [Parastagonospora nodorum]
MPKSKRKAVVKSKTPAKHTRAQPVSTKSKFGPQPVFFCDPDTSTEGGFLSPWYLSPFEVKSVKYLNSGQYILAEKARIFDDKNTLQKILDATAAEDLIALGDSISNVDDKVWRRRAAYIAKKANMFKFSSNTPDLRKQLEALGRRETVFADPSDAFLGIGFGVDDAEDVCRSKWGANVFGKAVEVARKELRIGPRDYADFDSGARFEEDECVPQDRGGFLYVC